MAEYKLQQQVLISRKISRSGPVTNDVRVGVIQAFADGGESVLVSIPRPGRLPLKETVAIADIKPVSEVFNRTAVQFNPLFRQTYKG